MRKLLLCVSLMMASPAVFAADITPFAYDIESGIFNYNRTSDRLATSGSIDQAAVDELSSKGFTTIIDIRTAIEGTAGEKRAVEKAGMRYINIPVSGNGITDAHVKEFARYFEASKGPVLLHCGSGNRVGGLLTRYYLDQGVPEDIAYEMGRAAGMRSSLEEAIKASLSE